MKTIENNWISHDVPLKNLGFPRLKQSFLGSEKHVRALPSRTSKIFERAFFRAFGNKGSSSFIPAHRSSMKCRRRSWFKPKFKIV